VARAGTGPADFGFRRLGKPEEFRQAEELQRHALGDEAALLVPAPLLKTIQETGGLVLGAFADIYLAGVAVSSLAWDGESLYQRSLLTLVRPEYRSHHVGLRLKAFQRDEVLGLGLSELRWAFDPLHRAAAALSVRRLGAVPDAYASNPFGQLTTSDGSREESDRLHVRWALRSPEVERRLAGELPGAEADRERHDRSTALVETELAETGLRLPTVVSEPSGAPGHLEVPFDLGSIREHEPGGVRRWRHAVRDAFRAALDAGYAVDGFAAVTIEHERRCFYFLQKAEPRAPSREGSAAASPLPDKRLSSPGR
jgi:predicted GNAT superfamily acetyltransferase